MDAHLIMWEGVYQFGSNQIGSFYSDGSVRLLEHVPEAAYDEHAPIQKHCSLWEIPELRETETITQVDGDVYKKPIYVVSTQSFMSRFLSYRPGMGGVYRMCVWVWKSS